jgi:hypothetical protein
MPRKPQGGTLILGQRLTFESGSGGRHMYVVGTKGFTAEEATIITDLVAAKPQFGRPWAMIGRKEQRGVRTEPYRINRRTPLLPVVVLIRHHRAVQVATHCAGPCHLHRRNVLGDGISTRGDSLGSEPGPTIGSIRILLHSYPTGIRG